MGKINTFTKQEGLVLNTLMVLGKNRMSPLPLVLNVTLYK